MNLPVIKSKDTGVIKISIRRAGGDIILLYRLTKELAEDALTKFQYTLTVTKVDNGGSRREVRRLPDITRSRTEAERIFDIVSRACVMPSTADEVICDLISI